MGYTNYIANNRVTIKTFRDNQRAITLAKNPYLTKRLKYINILYHFIRDLQECQRVDIKYILTAQMAADGFTKPLAKL